jgi:hypothetical protein
MDLSNINEIEINHTKYQRYTQHMQNTATDITNSLQNNKMVHKTKFEIYIYIYIIYIYFIYIYTHTHTHTH